MQGNLISLNDLYKLERLTSVTRARAKIQNEFKLFKADNRIKNRRRDNEEAKKESALRNKPIVPRIKIFADESGLNEDYIIVGSIWVLENTFEPSLTGNLVQWCAANKDKDSFPEEFHFTEMHNSKHNSLEHFKDFFDQLYKNAAMISYKGIAVNKTKLDLPKDQILTDLYSRIILNGVKQEISQRRISLPQQISYYKDQDNQDSRYKIDLFSDALMNNFQQAHQDRLKLSNYYPIPAKTHRIIQQADLFTGSLNRIYNHQRKNPQANINNKDKLAGYILQKLNVNVINLTIDNFEGKLEDDLQDNDRSTFLIYD